MENTRQDLQTILLAAAMLLPLAARAADVEREAPERGPRMEERRGPPDAGIDPRAGGRPGPHGRPDFGPAPFGGVPPYLRGVELTEAQDDKIFAIVHGQVPYLREQEKAREKAERGLFELHAAAKYDDAAAAKLEQAAAQATANLTLAHLRTEQKVLAVLTAEQRKALDEREGHGPRRDPRPAQ
jgi:Spy/CpxP family protein refolding chaperone